MFEFHGWASIRTDTYEFDNEARLRVLAELEKQMEEVRTTNVWVRLDRSPEDFLTVVGIRNHRYETVIGLFEWVAEHAPGSYGLLYVRDDEDHERGGDYQGVFRVWRLARGSLQERDDPFLSPTIPTIEDPYDAKRGDGF